MLWASTVGLAVSNSVLVAKMMRANSRSTVVFTAVVAVIMLVCSNPIAFLTVIAFPSLFVFYIYVLVTLGIYFIRLRRT